MNDEFASFDNAIRFIRAVRPEDIDPLFIEEVIMPQIGFGPVEPFLPPQLQQMCKKGICVQQMPIQFAPYCWHLVERRVRSYLEVGSAHGGSFILTCELLSKFSDVTAAIISMTGKSKFLRRYEEKFDARFDFFSIDSHSDEAVDIFNNRLWDHVFLDGDHSYDGMLEDFTRASNSASMVALHDISNIACKPGMEAWHFIKQQCLSEGMLVKEYVDQYKEEWSGKKVPGMGIGLVELRSSNGRSLA